MRSRFDPCALTVGQVLGAETLGESTVDEGIIYVAGISIDGFEEGKSLGIGGQLGGEESDEGVAVGEEIEGDGGSDKDE